MRKYAALLMLGVTTLTSPSLARDGALTPACTEEQARDVMWALASPELYEQLVTRSGWSDAAFQAWLSDALAALLLGPETRERGGTPAVSSEPAPPDRPSIERPALVVRRGDPTTFDDPPA